MYTAQVHGLTDTAHVSGAVAYGTKLSRLRRVELGPRGDDALSKIVAPLHTGRESYRSLHPCSFSFQPFNTITSILDQTAHHHFEFSLYSARLLRPFTTHRTTLRPFTTQRTTAPTLYHTAHHDFDPLPHRQFDTSAPIMSTSAAAKSGAEGTAVM